MLPSRGDRARQIRVSQVGYDYAAQPKEYRAACNLCGDERFAVIGTSDRYGFPVRSQICLRCGLGCQNPLLTPDACSRFYQTAYRPIISAFKGKEVNPHRVESIEKRFAGEIDDLLLSRFIDVGTHRTLLDIGGSVGAVAAHFAQKYRMKATVLDPSETELAEAARRGLSTVHGVLETHDFGDARFDVVLLCKTIDHLFDIDRSFAVMRRLISPNGLLFLDHNDFQALYLAFQSVERVVQVDHCYYLFREVVEMFFRKHGFRIAALDLGRDPWTVSYVCVPSEPRQLPDEFPYVQRYINEIREVRQVPYMLQRRFDYWWRGLARRTRDRLRG